MVKTLQKSSYPFIRNRRADFHETWYEASGSPAHYSFFSNDDRGMTLTYFTAMSNMETKAFLQEKLETVDFSKTIEAFDLKVGRYRQLVDFMKVCEY